VALSFLGSWFVAASLRVFGLTVAPSAVGTRLFTTSLLYAVTMGWQPLAAAWAVRRWVDPPDRLDLGLRPARWAFSVVGALAALGVAALATLVAWLAAALGLARPSPLHGRAEAELASGVASVAELVLLPLAFLGTVFFVWAQAFVEEVGWRGYFLPRAMERLGKWRGLVLHGAVWGLWYAPVLFFASYGPLAPSASLGRGLGFVVTCALLGTLLGWLRLASQSLVPVVVSNATLTLAAGLPYVVHGVDAGLRSAAFGPPGWLVLLGAIGGLWLSRWRSAVRTPEPLSTPAEAAPAVRVFLWVLPGAGPPRDHDLN
ncbi:MAG TPA: CPBP family intramembrane glutamic endopeptidase, partial [Polyangiaceae bacterium]|nr:CPBP family intramembrane glutamic endopeptidase [Polyangiaceae bacterium]